MVCADAQNYVGPIIVSYVVTDDVGCDITRFCRARMSLYPARGLQVTNAALTLVSFRRLPRERENREKIVV